MVSFFILQAILLPLYGIKGGYLLMNIKKKVGLLLCIVVMGMLVLTGCQSKEQKKIVRIGHNQSVNHPTHIALTAFQDYINEH